MKKWILGLIFSLSLTAVSGQLLSWTPLFPQDNGNVSITMDAAKGNQGLFNYSPVSDVYVHIGVITNQSTSPTNWRYVKFNQNFNQPNAQLQATSLGGNKWKFDITNIRAYFGVPAGETIEKIAILFRNGVGGRVQRNADGSDMYVPVSNGLSVHISDPLFQPTYQPIPEPLSKQVGDQISLDGSASATAALRWLVNGAEIQTAAGASNLTASYQFNTPGNYNITFEASTAVPVVTQSFQGFAARPPNILPLPAGARDGIN